MRIALVHYAAPPVIGGVERVMGQQAGELLKHGHEVVVVCGHGDVQMPGVRVQTISDWALEVQTALSGCQVVIIHNMLTMPFHDAAAQALALASRSMVGARFVNWVHDVDVARSWFYDLGFIGSHVAVSEVRRELFQQRVGIDATVVPNGLDIPQTLGWTPPVQALIQEHQVLERDMVVFHPTRILARKNIELGMDVTRVLVGQGVNVLYLVSGAPDPHRKSSAEYARFLGRHHAGLEDHVVFAGAKTALSDEDIRALYSIADILFFPSKTEGFGLPLIEALMHRVPVLCSDIPPHQEVAGAFAAFFPLDLPPLAIAAQMQEICLSSKAGKSRRETMVRFGWRRVFEDYLEPLLSER